MAGIYIHIPFCKQACHYCDFHFSTSLKFQDPLVEALIAEIGMRKNELNEGVETIYFGGGTPSILETRQIEGVLKKIKSLFKVSTDAEITLEANPDDLTLQKLRDLKQIGVNRLSIGVQSFFKSDLQYMNRAHSADDSLKCLQDARTLFDNITIDLIYGVPGMTDAQWLKNLQIAVDMGIPHLSCYALTVEEKTALAHFIKQGKYLPVEEQAAENHFKILVDYLKKSGYDHYEISNFGKPGYYSKHNCSYWIGKDYLGIGPSAHSLVGSRRSWNIANNVQYIKSIERSSLPAEMELLSLTDCINERIMIGLRTQWGIDLGLFQENFGEEAYAELLNKAEKFIVKKLISLEDKVLKISPKGKFLADGIASDLFFID